MRGMLRLMSAVVGGFVLLGASAADSAQLAKHPTSDSGGTVAVATGSIQGVVSDGKGTPVTKAVVSAAGGGVTTFAVTDRNGRFDLLDLAPGRYLLRVHLVGYTAPAPQVVDVRTRARTVSNIALQRADMVSTAPILAAGLGGLSGTQTASGPEMPGVESDGEQRTTGDPDETAWRLRHARRSILKDTSLSDAWSDAGPLNVLDGVRSAAAASVRVATDFVVDTPFSGQVNLLTAGSFETSRELFSQNAMSRGIAYVGLTAPAGANADWTVRGALTQADISAWIVAGSYATRQTAPHQRRFGLSYSTQRYDGGNPLALREVTDGSRNVGEIYGYETLTLMPALSMTYGGRYAQYDYLDGRNLISPQVELVLTPDEGLRISGWVSRRTLAPGAEEFLPPGDGGIWLPPQRTFSAVEPGQPLTAERMVHAAVGVERDFGRTTVGLRAFHQLVTDQLITLFGVRMGGQPSAQLGHYLVGSAGDAKATGAAASFAASCKRVKGSVEYSLTNAQLRSVDDLRDIVLMSSSAGRPGTEHIHDVAASVEAQVPETATRVLMLYRIGNAFSHAPDALDGGSSPRRAFNSRFDVQVRQSLPFMDFGTAKWQMLVAVRNFFRETTPDQSIYDELLVVRPPKRVVGGITMLF